MWTVQVLYEDGTASERHAFEDGNHAVSIGMSKADKLAKQSSKRSELRPVRVIVTDGYGAQLPIDVAQFDQIDTH